jgi:serine protease Do
MLDLPNAPIAQDQPRFGEPLPVDFDYSAPFVRVVDMARDAVVNITSEAQNARGGFLDDYFRFFGYDHPRVQRSYGSGFVFRDDGYILTNNHVIKGGDKILVTTSRKEEYEAQLIGADPATDLAVIKIEPREDLTVIPFGEAENLRIGEWVVAIGNPFPRSGLDRTVTVGVVSAKGRRNLTFADGEVTYQNYIQTDASINPGNSGGPLLNLKGEAVGINAAIKSPTGTSVGIGFAIPVDYARAVVPELIAHGRVSRGWLGIGDVRDLPSDMARNLDLDHPAVIFNQVFRGSPAAEAGLKPRDIIVLFNGKEFTDSDDFRFMVGSTPINETVPVDIIRDGEKMTVPVRIGDRSDALRTIRSPQQEMPYSDQNWLGMRVSECTPELAYELGIDCPPSGGVVVTDVMPGSPAYNRNIVPGVIIIEIDKYTINTVNDYREAAKALEDKTKSISFIIYDTEGNTRWVGIKPAP